MSLVQAFTYKSGSFYLKTFHTVLILSFLCLGLTVVAEGVETRSQLVKLKELGCDIIQGYYYSHPLPPEDFARLLLKSPYIDTPPCAIG